MKRRLLLCYLFILLNVILYSEIVVLQPGVEGKDTYICDCEPDTNNPNGSITHLYQGQFGTCFDRTLIQWDISIIPSGSSIESAIMELDFNVLYGTLAGEMVYHKITEPWEETEVTFNTQPAYVETPAVFTNWPNPGEWHPVDITDFVQYWIDDPGSNFGIYCHSINTISTCVAEFNSSDHAISENRPKLTIEYTNTPSQDNEIVTDENNFLSVYPNPFNPNTTIEFQTTKNDTYTEIHLFNMKGQKIRTLLISKLDAGKHTIYWDGKNNLQDPVESGLYLLQLKTGNKRVSKKILLLK